MSSMPAKGKQHHMPHHYQSHHANQQGQPHHQQQSPQQHLVNINQSGVAGTPQPYNTVVASRGYGSHAGSDFHVPGQNYGAQPGAQVGGGGGSIGVPGGRGPSLGGIPQIGQTTPGIQPGGPAGGQQQQQQQQTPGVQQQQQQGPAQTTTPPVHTPPQDMGKQAHLQTQPPSLQQPFVPNQTRPVAHTQGFYQMGPRPTQARGLHSRNQGGGQLMAVPNVATSAGQQPTMYPQNLGVPGTPTMYVSGQVPNMQQTPVYSMNNHMQSIVTYQQQQRHQAHQTQPFFAGYPPHAILPTNVYSAPYQHGHPGWNYYPTHTPPNSSINLSRASANAVSGGGQNVGGPLAGAQGTAGVPQGTLQQQTPQPQTIPPMAISLTQPGYVGHNGGAPNAMSSYQKVTIRSKAIIDIVDPETGKNIANDIYRTAATSEEPKPRETPQPQNSAIIAEFASRVAKAASEGSESSSTPSTSAQEHHNTTTTLTTTTTTTNLINSKTQLNTNKEQANTQCNTAPAPPVQSNIQIQSQITENQLTAQQIDTSIIDTKSVPSSTTWQRSDTKQLNTPTPPTPDDTQTSSVTNKDNIPIQKIPQVPQVVAATESDTKSSTSPATSTIPNPIDTTTPQPPREPFPTAKTASSSPPRRKSQQQQQQQAPSSVSSSASTPAAQAPTAPAAPSSEPVKEQKERKLSERSVSSRGTTPTPTQNPNEQKHLQKNGESGADKTDDSKAEQKSPEGKGTQKQKSKNKLKARDINRKGADKEGTDMDAFVNAAQQPVKTDVKTQQQDINETTLSTKPVTNAADQLKEISVKDKDLTEIKADLDQEEINQNDQDKNVKSETIKDNTDTKTEKILQNHKEISKETIPTIEDSNKSSTNLQDKRTNDVVDHANVDVKDVTDVEAIVAQKNEENNKVSGLSRAPSETKSTTPTIDKQNENEPPNQNDAKALPELKYQYDPDQWSPRNADGKKRYGRDLLMKLQEDPKSRIRPPNLLDLEVVLKDGTRQPVNRNPVDFSVFKGRSAHETLFPGFAKSSFNAKLPPPTNKKSYQSNKKPPKPNVIHVSLSLREDIKLRETENAWKPGRLKSEIMPEDDAKSQALYKKVRSVLNKLTPQKFATLVNQVRSLEIDTQERLQGVIDLVFEKAVDEPSFSVAYALMCKELSGMKVSTGETKVDENGKEVEINVDFRKLLVTRCQMEFEKNMIDESARALKVAEIDNTTDPDKKKELQLVLEDEDRKLRMKSVGNIRFIGELYKQEILITKIMHTCIKHLLQTPDEENLECLCKLFTTIGKILEGRSDPKVFPEYFNQLAELASKKSNKKINSRVRFMIQDVIDLRTNSWIPRRDESNPKTMDQIQKEAESERLEIQMNNTPMNTPRKDDRNRDRGKNRGGGGGGEDGWTVAPLGKSRQPYSIEAAKLTAKSGPLDEIKLGSRNAYLFGGSAAATGKPSALGTLNKFALLENMMPDQDKQRPMPQLSGSRSTGAREYRSEQYKTWEGRGSRNGGHMNSSLSSSREGPMMEASRSHSVSMPPPAMKYKPPTPAPEPSPPVSNKPVKTTEQLKKINRTVVDMANGSIQTEMFIVDAVSAMKDNFDNSTYPLFVGETLNTVFEKTSSIRQKFSALYAHMINKNMIPLSLFQSEYEKILEFADDLVIDIPKCWTYFAEILSEMVVLGAHPLAELKKTAAVLRNTNNCGKLVGELLSKLAKDIGPKVVAEKWNQSGLQWSDLVDTTRENPDDIIKKYKLEFLLSDYNSTEMSSSVELTYDQIEQQLIKLIRDSDFDNITRWISTNVGDRPKEPQFVRTLVNAILKLSIEHPEHPEQTDAYKLNSNFFKSALILITRYVDTAPRLEVECLIAIQVYLAKLNFPQGILGNIIDALYEGSIISDDAFFAWEACDDLVNPGHAVAMMALHSFFVHLREPHDESSEEA